MTALRFDGRVAVVTGAGSGLGRSYALELARRGAKVVVNDLGGSITGAGDSTAPADAVVDEILKFGGQATANYDSVENGENIIETAIKRYGRVDILINNAGIIRDVSFVKMIDMDWDLVDAVHLKGAYKCTRAAWAHMMSQKFGRIVNVTSFAGMYGNFGQVNYSTAKSGIIGFTKSCALEGAKRNVFSNCVAPVAASRLTETVMPRSILERLRPEFVVPLVLFYCHEDSGVNGEIVEAGGGWYARIVFARAKGAFIDGTPSVEDIKNSWGKISDVSDPDFPTAMNDTFTAILNAQTAVSKL